MKHHYFEITGSSFSLLLSPGSLWISMSIHSLSTQSLISSVIVIVCAPLESCDLLELYESQISLWQYVSLTLAKALVRVRVERATALYSYVSLLV